MEIELARISMIEYAGMKIASPSWILLDLGKGLGPQLWYSSIASFSFVTVRQAKFTSEHSFSRSGSWVLQWRPIGFLLTHRCFRVSWTRHTRGWNRTGRMRQFVFRFLRRTFPCVAFGFGPWPDLQSGWLLQLSSISTSLRRTVTPSNSSSGRHARGAALRGRYVARYANALLIREEAHT